MRNDPCRFFFQVFKFINFLLGTLQNASDALKVGLSVMSTEFLIGRTFQWQRSTSITYSDYTTSAIISENVPYTYIQSNKPITTIHLSSVFKHIMEDCPKSQLCVTQLIRNEMRATKALAHQPNCQAQYSNDMQRCSTIITVQLNGLPLC